MTWLKKHIFEIVLVVLAAAFFVLYQFLYLDFFSNPLPKIQYAGEYEPGFLIFNQPDEMANYLFIREWVLHNRIGLPEPLSQVTQSQLHPRSMTVVNGQLVPISFPGFIVLAAMVLKALHFWDNGAWFNYVVVMITPLSAAVAPLFLYGIVRRVFERRGLAFMSAVGLFVLPAWWYYASRPLQHMTMFITLLLAAAYSLIENKTRLHPWTLFLFTFFWGLALYIRPTEWLWTLILFGSLITVIKPKLNASSILSGIIGITAVGALFFATQTAFYGHPLASGYVRPQTSGAGGLLTAGPQGISLVTALFLPFGFNPWIMIKTAYYYGFKLFAPWFVSALIGLGLVWSSGNKKLKNYSLMYIGVAGLIFLYYGSWNFSDNLAGLVSIGSSQVRYFLPIYLLSLPFIVFLISKLWTMHAAGKLTAGMVVIVLGLFSIKSVYLRFEGLWPVKTTVSQYYDWQRAIFERTPSAAIIATRYADKYIFPGRRVIVNWQGEGEIRAIATLAKLGFPIYWYDVQLNQTDRARLDINWQAAGLILSHPVAGWDNLELRLITFKK